MMHLTLLLLDFKIVETISLAKRRHVGPRVCLRRVLRSLLVKLYQMDGFVHRTST
jgi:hypothetical protein